MIFISITAASYEGIRQNQTDQASALINVARNVGGSMGVSLAQNILAYRSQFHQSRLVESIDADEPGLSGDDAAGDAVLHTTACPAWRPRARRPRWIGQQLHTQMAYFAYIDVFWALCLVSASAVPLAMILKRVERGKGAPAGGHRGEERP